MIFLFLKLYSDYIHIIFRLYIIVILSNTQHIYTQIHTQYKLYTNYGYFFKQTFCKK